MQAVQLDQLLPQVQTLQSAPQSLSTGDTSFMDALRASQSEFENTEKISEVDDKQPEETTASAKTSEKENSIYENYTVMANLVQETAGENKLTVKVEFNDEQISQISEAKNPENISETQLKWLFESTDKTSADDFVSSEDVAALIEAAQEFIPGEASPDELLEQAQTLAVKDPEAFLEKAEKTAVADLSSLKENLFEQKNGSKDKKVAEKTDGKVRFDVTDLRTAKIDKNSSEMAATKVQSKKDFNLSYKKESENSVQVTMDLSAAARQNITSSSSQAAGANGSTFQSMLANAVQENAPDFVKAGNIVLKDNNQGNINLILHPEKLGNVKISLSLSDKVISGSITVHSQEAYDAMKDSIASLKNAFANSGFEAGEFNLNFTDNSQQFAQNQGHAGQDQQAGFRANRSYGDFTVNSAVIDADVEAAYAAVSDYSVNIVA